MIVLSPGNKEYKKGQKIPFIQIPLDAEGEEISLEDFQWWGYSKDFHKWLKENPRDWTAESISQSTEDVLFHQRRNIGSHIKDYQNFINETEAKGSNYNYDFINESEDADDESLHKKLIKFNYAYNRLLAADKLDLSFNVNSIESEQQALFLNFAGEEDDEEGLPVSLQAYRGKVLKTGSDKFNLIDIDYAIPVSGEIKNDDNFSDVIDDVIKYGITTAAVGGAGTVLWMIAKGGLGVLGIKLLLNRMSVSRYIKRMNSLMPGAKAAKEAAANAKRIKKAARLAKATKVLKSGLGTVTNLVTLKNTRTGLGSVVRASRLKSIKPVGLLRAFVKGAGISNVFPKFMGKTAAKVGGKGLSKLVPFVGEVLMAVDAVYSLWSWNRDSQAPKFGEVEDFAKGEFVPKDIKAGIPITICWSQPSGSMLNWVATDETRTTIEIVKVGTSKGRSIFIVTQANSEGLQKVLSDNALVMASFAEDDKFERHWYDNNDLDFELITIKEEAGLLAPFLYQGHIDWETFENEYNKAENYLFSGMLDAPLEYAFNFKDADGDIINITGDKVDDETIQTYKDSELEAIFGYSENFKSVDESISFANGVGIRVHKKMIDFLNENKSEDDDEDSTLTLTPEMQSGPAHIALYKVEEASYANVAIADKKKIPTLGLYIVDEGSISVEDGTPILVASTIGIEFTDSTMGLYEHNEAEKDTKETDIDDKQDSNKDKDKDPKDGQKVIITSADDVSYKERQNSILIRDGIKRDGVNLMREFLTDEDKVTLQIRGWKGISKIKVKKAGGVIRKITFKNRDASSSDNKREYTRVDGEAFEIAKKLVNSVRDGIEYN